MPQVLNAGLGLLLVANAIFFHIYTMGMLNFDNYLGDFGSFIESGRAAARGLDPYGIYPMTGYATVGDVELRNPNLNPPVSLLVFRPMARLEPKVAHRAWLVISIVLYVVVLVLLARAYREHVTPLHLTWALCLPGLWDTLKLGQIYIALLLLATGAWLCLRNGRHLWAGLLIGSLVAIKPNFLIWPALLLLAGYWTTALTAGITATGLSLAPLLVFGPKVYAQWLALIASDSARTGFPTNVSLPGLSARFGVPWLGLAIAAVVVVVLAGWALSRRPDAISVSRFGLIASLLASPIAWVTYTLLLLPIFFERHWSWPLRLVGILLALPPIALIFELYAMGQWYSVALSSIYTWALLLLLAIMVRQGLARRMAPAVAPSTDTGRRPLAP